MAFENKLLDRFFRAFSLELPPHDTMDAYLDTIIPLVRPWSEDLRETEYYLGTRWLEVRDQDDFQEAVLHIFQLKDTSPEADQSNGEYLHSIDGNIHVGVWRKLDRSNTLILEQASGGAGKSELYDLAFLNPNFFILRKHGDQKRKGFNKYFVMGRESYIRGLEWRDVMELLFNRYRNNTQWILFVTVVVILIAIFIVFSIF